MCTKQQRSETIFHAFYRNNCLSLPCEVSARFPDQRLLLSNSIPGMGWRAYMFSIPQFEQLLQKVEHYRRRRDHCGVLEEIQYDHALIVSLFRNDEIIDLPIRNGRIVVPDRMLVGFRKGSIWMSMQDGYVSLNTNRLALRLYSQPPRGSVAG